MIIKQGTSKELTLKCEDCHQLRVVQRNRALLEKKEHPCRKCSNKRNGLKKKGKPSWNAGKKFKPKKIGSTHTDYHGYVQVWLGKHNDKKNRQDGYYALHKHVVEEHIGRQLEKGEIVHHIDNVKTNNDISNLHVCPSISEHRNTHKSIEEIAFKLYQKGIIRFDRDKSKYYLPPDVETLLENLFNSGEP